MWAMLLPIWNWFGGIGQFFKQNKWAIWAVAGIAAFLRFKYWENEQQKKYTEIGRKQVEEEVRELNRKRSVEAKAVLEQKIKDIQNEQIPEPDPVEIVDHGSDVIPDADELRDKDPDTFRRIFK